ncbi:hypothetical protein [Rhizobium leguminosarum]|uniref:hypothetical protein n=1 Tax=Rhizobium leguminosarum TaxID=384 RepID=UPI0013BC7A69|nr:hypothetical protein [Rhizobium leguminosarum]NEI64974.1 hypothetical protein [Rhizobium leguminosarum]
MAKKLTRNIRISEYDVLNNQFNLTFQLAGYDDKLTFGAVFDKKSTVFLEYDAEDRLYGLGFPSADLDQMIAEIVGWLQKPRKHLGDLSHSYTLQTRFEVTERLEAERRGKAEAERIIAAAPPLDWARSVTEEMEDEPNHVTGNAVAEKVKALEAAGLGEDSSSWKVSIGGEVSEELSTSLGSFMALHVNDPYFDNERNHRRWPPSSLSLSLRS